MPTPDLWPADLVDTSFVPPAVILREQAELFTKKMQGVLEGSVTTQKSGTQSSLITVFDILAPALGDFKYRLLFLVHDAIGYPCTMSFLDTKAQFANPDQLIDGLRQAFAHESTRRIVSSLVAQSKGN